MLQRSLYAGLILALACSVGPAGDKGKPKGKEMDNPFKTAKVGDFTAYKLSTKIGDLAVDGTMKQTVTAKDDKTVTLKMTASVLGMETPPQITTIDLTKPFDPLSVANQGNKAQKAKFDKTGEGKEKIKVGGKEYDCTYITGKSEAEALGQKINADVKIWFSKAVPLNGMLKMETKTNLADIVIELSESGSEKAKE